MFDGILATPLDNDRAWSISTQLIFTCSKSAIETLEKGVKLIKVNNKNTKMSSMT